MPILKESGPQWLVGMAEYISDNLEYIVKWFAAAVCLLLHLPSSVLVLTTNGITHTVSG